MRTHFYFPLVLFSLFCHLVPLFRYFILQLFLLLLFLIDVILFAFQRSVSIVINDDDNNNDGVVEHVLLSSICKLLLSAMSPQCLPTYYL